MQNQIGATLRPDVTYHVDKQVQHEIKQVCMLSVCLFVVAVVTSTWGTGFRGLMRGMATLSQCNQELIVVRDKVGRPQVSLG